MDSSPHMSADTFRKLGHQAVDWIARYLEEVEDYPVLSRSEPGALRAQLPPQAPREPQPLDTIFDELDRLIMPGITHWQSPNFFAFFPCNNSGPSILGELISAGLGVQGMLWATSPACTELETHMLDWLAEMLGLPENFRSTGKGGGVLQDSASSATLCALLAAREKATSVGSNSEGAQKAALLTAYCSTQAHSSVEKAVRIAGIGSNQLRKVDVDAGFAMSPENLEQRIEQDIGDGNKPFFVSATLGTTSSAAVDPLQRVGEICQKHNVWLHVDAAMYGTAAICPEFRWIHQGVDLAHSYCFNPHKWMLVNFDCDCFYVSDRSDLVSALTILPDYLKNRASDSGQVIDYRDWQVPLGRRFRALKLWFVIRHYGVQGIQQHIREHLRLARLFESWLDESPDLVRAAASPFSLVCFRHRLGDQATRQVMDEVNRSGRLFLTDTRLQDRLVLRMAIGATLTTARHVERAWKQLAAAAARITTQTED